MLSTELAKLIDSHVPLLYINGPEESRYLQLLKTFGYNVFSWNNNQGLQPGANTQNLLPVDVLKHILHYNAEKAIFVLCDFHHYLDNPMVIRLLKEISYHSRRRGNVSVVLISPLKRIPPEIEKEIIILEASLPTSKEIYTFLSQSIKKMIEAGIITPAFSQKQLLIQTIQNLKGLTINQMDTLLSRSIAHRKKIDPDYILREKTKILSNESLLNLVDTNRMKGISNIGGLNNVKQWLSERMSVFKGTIDKKINRVTIDQFNIPVPKGVLLTGVQGCGKSFLAKAAAKEWRLPLLWLDMGKIFTSRVGQSESQMRAAIKVAESMSPCILFIDEFEKGFSGMQSSGLTDGGTAARVFGYFLVWLEERKSRIFVIATTNDVQMLPPEIMRKGRFDEIFFIDLPCRGEREEIFSIHLKEFNLNHLVKYSSAFAEESEGFSGAEIKEVVISSLYKAYVQQIIPDRDDLFEAIKSITPLSKMRDDEIASLRDWAKGRCKPANLTHEESNSNKGSKVLDFPGGVITAINNG